MVAGSTDRPEIFLSRRRADTTDRIRALEDEQAMLRQELTELQERQDFTERALVRERDQVNRPSAAALPERVVTPH
jgi:hypothetical protein